MFKIYPYKVGSASVRKLKELLDATIIRTENSQYRYRAGHKLINWGNSRRPAWMTSDVAILNRPEAVAIASNKLHTLEALASAGVAHVPYTTDKDLATDWLTYGTKVFARQTLTGHSGEGISVHKVSDSHLELDRIAGELEALGHKWLAERVMEEYNEIIFEDSISILPQAPLYTQGIDNHGEYRVHVGNGEVILYQKKSRRIDEDGNVVTAEGEEADIRNLASNWVYRTGNLRRLERIEKLAIDAVTALSLDFGAVDIIKNQNGEVFVLEVNCAPGLKNEETCLAYQKLFKGEVE